LRCVNKKNSGIQKIFLTWGVRRSYGGRGRNYPQKKRVKNESF